ncbi:MAG: pyruvate kinase [Desulfobacterales bacterium]
MRRRTKIITTLGPATDDDSTIEKLIRAGIDLVRINSSHTAHGLIIKYG